MSLSFCRDLGKVVTLSYCKTVTDGALNKLSAEIVRRDLNNDIERVYRA